MFVQIIQGHVADTEGFRRQGDRWEAELRPGTRGFLGTTGGITADGTAILAARFESTEAARANSERPEQGTWWADMERCFDGPVTFAESSDVEVLLAGGSGPAAFVQVMKGSTDKRSLLAEMDQLFTTAAPTWRPDVIGGLRAWITPTDYVEIIYFTSEAQARANEQSTPPPAVIARMADFEAMMAGSEYLDLTEPFFT